MTTARSDDLLLSIDCGTQSTRALLFDACGSLVAKAQVALDDYVVERPGWMSHDVEGFWLACARACRQLWAERPGLAARVRGVSVTTQRGTIMPVLDYACRYEDDLLACATQDNRLVVTDVG